MSDSTDSANSANSASAPARVERSEEEWRRILTPEQYRVAREQGTEPAFTGVYWDEHRPGIYRCVACGQNLFNSETKYDSGSGWPSFNRPIAQHVVEAHADTSHGMTRTEVVCSRCGSHLGHVFPDGPGPTGLRYCMNSASLDLVSAETPAEADGDTSAGRDRDTSAERNGHDIAEGSQ